MDWSNTSGRIVAHLNIDSSQDGRFAPLSPSKGPWPTPHNLAGRKRKFFVCSSLAYYQEPILCRLLREENIRRPGCQFPSAEPLVPNVTWMTPFNLHWVMNVEFASRRDPIVSVPTPPVMVL